MHGKKRLFVSGFFLSTREMQDENRIASAYIRLQAANEQKPRPLRVYSFSLHARGTLAQRSYRAINYGVPVLREPYGLHHVQFLVHYNGT